MSLILPPLKFKKSSYRVVPPRGDRNQNYIVTPLHSCIVALALECTFTLLLAYTIASLLGCAVTLLPAGTIACELDYIIGLRLRPPAHRFRVLCISRGQLTLHLEALELCSLASCEIAELLYHGLRTTGSGHLALGNGFRV